MNRAMTRWKNQVVVEPSSNVLQKIIDRDRLFPGRVPKVIGPYEV